MNFKQFLETTLQLTEKDHDFLHHIAEEEFPACKVIDIKLLKLNPTVIEFHVDCKDVPREEGLQADLTEKLAARLDLHSIKSLGKITPRVLHVEKDSLTVESTASLKIGNEVIVSGKVQHQGEVGVISSMSGDGRFVGVDLRNSGKASFHASDISLHHGDDEDEDEFHLHVGDMVTVSDRVMQDAVGTITAISGDYRFATVDVFGIGKKAFLTTDLFPHKHGK